MTSINTGFSGADQQRLNSLQRNTERTQTSVERLTTGKRINRPKDDPAGFIAAEGLRQEITDLKQKVKNIGAERANSHTRQSGLANIQDTLTDLRGQLGSLTAEQRIAFEAEIDAAAEAIARIAGLTNNHDSINFNVASVNLAANPNAADIVDSASKSVTNERVALAAHERTHLDTFKNLYEDQIAITSQVLSQIEDTDFAAETANLAQSQVLAQSSIAAIAYAGRQNAAQLTLLLDAIA